MRSWAVRPLNVKLIAVVATILSGRLDEAMQDASPVLETQGFSGGGPSSVTQPKAADIKDEEVDVRSAKRRCLPSTVVASADVAVKAEVDRKDAAHPLTLSSEGGGTKQQQCGIDDKAVQKKEEKQPLQVAPATIASTPRSSMRVDGTQLSQPKVEPKLEDKAVGRSEPQGSQPQRVLQQGSQLQGSQLQCPPKPEQAAKPEEEKNGNALVESSALANASEAPEASKQPVVHPTGKWLRSLPKKTDTKQELTVLVDGVEIRRAAAHPGCFQVYEAPPPPPSVAVQPAGSGRVVPNFKLFRKAEGQRRAEGLEIVPVALWVPREKAPLDDFCSQPVESQSQFPPMCMSLRQGR
jgi:hypothetical protein